MGYLEKDRMEVWLSGDELADIAENTSLPHHRWEASWVDTNRQDRDCRGCASLRDQRQADHEAGFVRTDATSYGHPQTHSCFHRCGDPDFVDSACHPAINQNHRGSPLPTHSDHPIQTMDVSQKLQSRMDALRS